MKLSILTITRNDLDGLRRTLESVRSQYLPDGVQVEHVVVDSSDKDIAERVRKSSGSSCVYVYTPPQGIYPALNKALAVSTGQVIGILNGGDVYADHDCLKRVADSLQSSRADYLLSDVVFSNSIRYYSGNNFSVESMELGISPPHPGFYASRKVYKAIGNYNESYRIGADFELFARLVQRSDFKGSHLPGSLVVMAPGGISQTWYNRIFVITREKHRALREQGLRAGWLRMCGRFFHIIYKQFILRPRK